MKNIPTLQTARLVLRPFEASDASMVRTLAGDREVYETTTTIPHPYKEGMAEHWISTHQGDYDNDKGLHLAITLKDGTLLGAIGFKFSLANNRAEVGYWIGVPHWNQGFCTEALQAIIEFGFRTLGLHKITARHLLANEASGRVLIKTGMWKEGELKDEVLKDGVFHTVAAYAIINGNQT